MARTAYRIVLRRMPHDAKQYWGMDNWTDWPQQAVHYQSATEAHLKMIELGMDLQVCSVEPVWSHDESER